MPERHVISRTAAQDSQSVWQSLGYVFLVVSVLFGPGTGLAAAWHHAVAHHHHEHDPASQTSDTHSCPVCLTLHAPAASVYQPTALDIPVRHLARAVPQHRVPVVACFGLIDVRGPPVS